MATHACLIFFTASAIISCTFCKAILDKSAILKESFFKFRSSIVDCGPLTSQPDMHIELEGNNTKVGAKAVYSCLENYLLLGTSERICQSDGTWSEDEPACLYSPKGQL